MLPDVFRIETRKTRITDYVRLNDVYYVGVMKFYLFDEEFVIEVGMEGDIELQTIAHDSEYFKSFCVFVNKNLDERFVHGGI